MSQMVGVQAATNVLLGERYKTIGKEVKAYCRGEYGQAPGEIDKDLMEKALGAEHPITCRYADLLEPKFEDVKAELKDVARSEEDVLSYIAFPQQAEKFFAARKEKEEKTVKYTIEEIKEDNE
jgi:oxaloacetate decarboxylase alpha subunit